ncbi:MAG: hypothetical protein ABI599_11475 [Flavobacteriales bacterium]
MTTHRIAFAALLGGALIFAACGSEPGKETERTTDQMSENRQEMANADDSKEWMNERDEAVKELNDLRENMFARQAREQKRLADGIKDADRKAECERHIAELQINITRVDAALLRMTTTTATDWANLKMETRVVADSTGNWFKREAERIDKMTDADNDKDGH